MERSRDIQHCKISRYAALQDLEICSTVRSGDLCRKISRSWVKIFSGTSSQSFRSDMIKPTIFMGIFWRALFEKNKSVILPKSRHLLDGTAKITGRHLRMLPYLVFRGLSWAVFRFSRVVVWLFVHIVSPEDIMIFRKISSKIHYFWPHFWLLLVNSHIFYPPEKNDWLLQNFN